MSCQNNGLVRVFLVVLTCTLKLTFGAELAAAAGEFAQAIGDLSQSDNGLGVHLAGALAGLATVERKAQELMDKQAAEDTMTMMSTG